mgnify:CR=1 FL=1
MSEKKPDAAPPPDKAAEAAPAKKKLPIKTIGMVAGLMIVEAVAVFVLVGGGSPKASHGETAAAELHDDEGEKTAEVELISDKFQNMTTGQAWVWQVAIFLQVKNKNSDRVDAVLEQRRAEIREGLSQIIGKARHTQLTEPEKQTLSRQVGSFLEKLDSMTVDGKSVIERVIFADCRGFPTQY